ncbi:hypothetical protein [Roseibium sp. SCP14]|uniref:hypothetical protein n=1 Tax=Roseibium sp. SCP14 TaxID=3141375 RepID=UPI0033382D26
MSFQLPPDLAALADRPDFEVSVPEEPEPGFFRRIGRMAASLGIFLGATILVAVIFFVPVLIFNVSRIEALEIAGQQISASLFAEQLGALFWGTAVLALAFTSFVASILMFASGLRIRPRNQPFSREDALHHLAVLRLSGPER